MFSHNEFFLQSCDTTWLAFPCVRLSCICKMYDHWRKVKKTCMGMGHFYSALVNLMLFRQLWHNNSNILQMTYQIITRAPKQSPRNSTMALSAHNNNMTIEFLDLRFDPCSRIPHYGNGSKRYGSEFGSGDGGIAL